uniref:RHOMBOID-like protein n=1 Tax=Manihot esculenta TaxID=3983 RepID=A0A2C9WLJ8_MANES
MVWRSRCIHSGGEYAVQPVASSSTLSPKRSTPSSALPYNNPHHQQYVLSDDFRPFKWVSNILLFFISMYVNDCPKNSESCIGKFLGRFSFQPVKENPLLVPSSSTLEKMGALDVDKVVHRHQAWRLISCIWLHAGVFHLLANMLSLVFIGIRLEQEFGFRIEWRVEVSELVCGIGSFCYSWLNISSQLTLLKFKLDWSVIFGFAGSLLSALFIQLGISIGASGALFGLLRGMLLELITNWTIYANKMYLAARMTLILIIVINLAVGILPHVDNFAHIGGFLSGFLLGFVLLIWPHFGWYVLWVVSLMLLIFGFTAGLVALLQGVDLNNHCFWCHYLSCVPTSLLSCNNSQKAYCESSQIGNQFNLTCLSNGKNHTYQL